MLAIETKLIIPSRNPIHLKRYIENAKNIGKIKQKVLSKFLENGYVLDNQEIKGVLMSRKLIIPSNENSRNFIYAFVKIFKDLVR